MSINNIAFLIKFGFIIFSAIGLILFLKVITRKEVKNK